MASLVRFLSRSVVARSAGVASIAQRTAATAVPPEVPFRPEEYTPEELEICEYCPIPVPYSAKEHFYMIKKFRAARAAGFQPNQFEQALNEYDVSIGAFSLEWVLPSPPPVHTFEEPPVIKEGPDYHHH